MNLYEYLTKEGVNQAYSKAEIDFSDKDTILIKMAETSDLEQKMIIKLVDKMEEKLLSDFKKKYIDIVGVYYEC
jgi:hypothetical protein